MKVKILLGVVILTIGLMGLSLGLNSVLAADSISGSLEAENMTLPAGGIVISDTAASAGQAAELTRNGNVTGSISLGGSGTKIGIMAKANTCRGGWPSMRIYVDGRSIANVAVRTTTWTEFSFDRALTAGDHSLQITFRNQNTTGGCNRNLYLDKIVVYGSPTPIELPSVTLSADPASVMNGDSSVLSWTSVNADSCTASGAWSGAKVLSGSESTGPLTSNQSYLLTCSNVGGSTSRSVTVTVATVTPPPGGSCTIADTSGCLPATTLSYTDTFWRCTKPLGNYGALPIKVILDYTGSTVDVGADITTGCAGDGNPDTVDLILDVRGDGLSYGPNVDAVKVRAQAGYNGSIQITGQANCGPRANSTVHQDGVQAQGGRDITFVDFNIGNYDAGYSTCQGAGGAFFYSAANGYYAENTNVIRGKYIGCVHGVLTGSSSNSGNVIDALFKAGRVDGSDPVCTGYNSPSTCGGEASITPTVTRTNITCLKWDSLTADWLPNN